MLAETVVIGTGFLVIVLIVVLIVWLVRRI